jgi:hypothetical protein
MAVDDENEVIVDDRPEAKDGKAREFDPHWIDCDFRRSAERNRRSPYHFLARAALVPVHPNRGGPQFDSAATFAIPRGAEGA